MVWQGSQLGRQVSWFLGATMRARVSCSVCCLPLIWLGCSGGVVPEQKRNCSMPGFMFRACKFETVEWGQYHLLTNFNITIVLISHRGRWSVKARSLRCIWNLRHPFICLLIMPSQELPYWNDKIVIFQEIIVLFWKGCTRGPCGCLRDMSRVDKLLIQQTAKDETTTELSVYWSEFLFLMAHGQ